MFKSEDWEFNLLQNVLYNVGVFVQELALSCWRMQSFVKVMK